MAIRELSLDPDPAVALTAVRAASEERAVLVFKRSPVCPVSWAAERELAGWRQAAGSDADVAIAVVDVIAERPLARGLTAALEVQHESPQALWFEGGELVAHGSHGALTAEWFEERRARREG